MPAPATFEYAPNKPIALRFSVENVLNSSNWSTTFLNATAPNMPRTFLLSLTGTF